MRGTQNQNDDEPPQLSGTAVAIGEVLAVLEAHAHRPGLVSFTRRAFGQAMPEAVSELEVEEQQFQRRERIVTTTRDSDVLVPYARLTVQFIAFKKDP